MIGARNQCYKLLVPTRLVQTIPHCPHRNSTLRCRVLFFVFVTIGNLGSNTQAGEHRVIRGSKTQLADSTWFTFTKESPTVSSPYILLKSNDLSCLLRGVRAVAPPEFGIKQDELNIELQPKEIVLTEYSNNFKDRKEHIYTHKAYVITGEWTVDVPQTCTPGDYGHFSLIPTSFRSSTERNLFQT
jgi:hypothetical protein